MSAPLDMVDIEARAESSDPGTRALGCQADRRALLDEVKRLRADLALMTQVAEKGRDVAQLAGRQRDQAREQRDALILACDATRAERDHAVEERRALAARAVSVVVAASEQRNASGAVASLGSAAKLARAIDALAEQVGETPKNWSPSWGPVREERDAALARLEKARGLVLEFAANMGPGFFDSYPTLVKLRAALAIGAEPSSSEEHRA